MSAIRRFYNPLAEFVKSNAGFKIIYSTSGDLSSTKRICILDSSFNPPHLGHYTLIEESLRQDYGTKESLNERSVLFLLSVKNADKVDGQPESFVNRLEMIYLMANSINERYNINVNIGLTSHAKFVDKSVSILEYFGKSKTIDINDLKMTFLVGFDTLIRILNPKYYLPDKLSASLDSFMKKTDLLCMTRVDTTTIDSAEIDQSNFINEIGSGKHENIPSHWSKKIFLVDTKGNSTNYISSSNIRSGIHNKTVSWYEDVIPEVKDFIIKENLYK